MTEVLNYTQKAFSSALRQRHAKPMRYQPAMPKVSSRMPGVQGGSVAVHQTQAEA